MFIIQYRKIFVSISAVLVIASFLALLVWGVRPSIDFTGGTLFEIENGSVAREEINTAIQEAVGVSASLRPTDGGFIIRTPELSPSDVTALETTLLGLSDEVSVLRISTVGPSLGDELFTKAMIALALVALGIMIFVAIAFWRVSKPVSSWVYGLVTLGTLVHDVIIPAGVFALLGFVLGLEVDALFVVALLTILGYSVNDTIVVFDRIRENLRTNKEMEKHEDFDRVVGRSLMQTYARSINTSLTTIVVLLALFFFGGDATQDFALALIIGVAAGAYSSIFFAAPFLVMISNLGTKKKTQ